MATITTNPRRRLSRVPNAPTYANLASRYSDTFQKAIDQAEANDLNTKLNLFRLGQLDYASFKSYLEQKIKDAPAGSKKQTDFTGLMVDAEKFNKQQIEETAKNTVEKLRTQLLEKIPGQVTNKDELRIVRELKKAIDPNSGVYADLVVEEAKIKNSLATEGAAGGKKGMQDNLDKYYAYVSAENKNILDEYSKGRIDGYTADKKLYENGLEMLKAINQAEKAGVNVPREMYTNEKGVGVVDLTEFVKNRLVQREVGQIFDVMNKSGVVEPVTHQELEADKLKTSPDFIRSKYELQDANPALPGKIFNVIDTSTGEKINSFPVKMSDAANLRKQMEDKNGYAVVVPKATANGVTTLQQYNYDPKTQSYSTAENPNQKVYSPVATGFENRFATQPNTTLNDFINAGINKVKSFISPETNTIDYDKLNQNLYPVSDQMGPFMSPTILSAPTTNKKTAEITTAPEREPATPVTEPNVFQRGAKVVKDFFGSAKQIPTPITPPGNLSVPEGNLDISGINFGNTPFNLNLPKINVPEVNLPSFNLNLGGFSAPSATPELKRQSGPTMAPSSGGFLDKLKSFGQSAIGSVKKFFGF